MYTLHPRLAEDCVVVGDLPLCTVLLSRDSRYPWLILVPRRAGVREVYELSEEDQWQLCRESSAVARVMADHFQAQKMNIAALGNQVPQLHIHHIARYESDPAWPGPVWGVLPPQPYEDDALESRRVDLWAQISALELQ